MVVNRPASVWWELDIILLSIPPLFWSLFCLFVCFLMAAWTLIMVRNAVNCWRFTILSGIKRLVKFQTRNPPLKHFFRCYAWKLGLPSSIGCILCSQVFIRLQVHHLPYSKQNIVWKLDIISLPIYNNYD